MTVLELMIVMAILGGAVVLVRSGFRMITKADLVEDSTELAAVLRRAAELAIEHGEMHRVVLDVDKQLYVVEVCQGATAIQRNEALRVDKEAAQRALEKGRAKFTNMGSAASSALASDPEDAAKRALAIAGHHVADRTCIPATDSITGDVAGEQRADGKIHAKGWSRALRAAKGIKFKEVWVQHRDDSVTKGQVGIYFFPTGSAEKAVIEVTDGSETFTVKVFGLTGRVELMDGVLRDVNDHMLKNALGDKDAKREDQR
jgi:type II secretory pathway pseudopilin PulG